MLVAHAYLIGILAIAVIFSIICYLRKDLLKIMIYSGTFYLVFMTVCFLLTKILSNDPAKMITPGYWSPPSLFKLNEHTGGLGIEDIFYMFFVGAIASVLYKFVFKFKVSRSTIKKPRKRYALWVGLIIASLAFVLTPINAVDYFIILQFVGALTIIWQRRDLINHALWGGFLYMALYWGLFVVFNILFPSFLSNYYHLQDTTHVFIGSVPLEEILYALTLGLMWSPFYEYMHQIKSLNKKPVA